MNAQSQQAGRNQLVPVQRTAQVVALQPLHAISALDFDQGSQHRRQAWHVGWVAQAGHALLQKRCRRALPHKAEQQGVKRPAHFELWPVQPEHQPTGIKPRRHRPQARIRSAGHLGVSHLGQQGLRVFQPSHKEAQSGEPLRRGRVDRVRQRHQLTQPVGPCGAQRACPLPASIAQTVQQGFVRAAAELGIAWRHRQPDRPFGQITLDEMHHRVGAACRGESGQNHPIGSAQLLPEGRLLGARRANGTGP
ncbi:MAG: hypothetical protein EBQ71_05765, partial [Betaproteobacteria bacterium]|nr:hypothetical protein [Betaproteobacteria bacterium]